MGFQFNEDFFEFFGVDLLFAEPLDLLFEHCHCIAGILQVFRKLVALLRECLHPV